MSRNNITLQPEKSTINESPAKEKLCRVKWQVILVLCSTLIRVFQNFLHLNTMITIQFTSSILRINLHHFYYLNTYFRSIEFSYFISNYYKVHYSLLEFELILIDQDIRSDDVTSFSSSNRNYLFLENTNRCMIFCSDIVVAY